MSGENIALLAANEGKPLTLSLSKGASYAINF